MYGCQWLWKVYLKGLSLNFTICGNILLQFLIHSKDIFLLGKIQEQGQSAGNFINITNIDLSSSETTREIFMLKDNLFKLWFIGFSEGNDYFIVNKDGYLEFKITQSSVDAQVLFYIKKKTGFGVVRVKDRNNKTLCFRIIDKNNLLKIICIFNGNIFLNSRKKQFKLWLEAFNLKYKENIPYLDFKYKPTLNDAWLCGFTDAEGCFTCSLYKNVAKTYRNLDCLVKNNDNNYSTLEFLFVNII